MPTQINIPIDKPGNNLYKFTITLNKDIEITKDQDLSLEDIKYLLTLNKELK